MNSEVYIPKLKKTLHRMLTPGIIVISALYFSNLIMNPSLLKILLLGILIVGFLIHQYNEAGLIILIGAVILFTETPPLPNQYLLCKLTGIENVHSFGPWMPNIIEILIVITFFIYIAQSIVYKRSNFRFERSFLNKPMAIFAIAGLFSAIASAYRGTSAHDVFLEWRSLTYIPTIYFLAVHVLKNREQINRVLLFLVLFIMFKGMGGIYLYFMEIRPYGLEFKSILFGLDPVFFGFFLFLLIVSVTIESDTGFHKKLLLGGSIPVFFSLLFSWRGYSFVQILFGTTFVFLLLPAFGKFHFLRKFSIVVLISVFLIILYSNIHPGFFDPVLNVFHQKFSLETHSNYYRIIETKNAIATIKEHPIFGVGQATAVEIINPSLAREEILGSMRKAYSQHNTYLALWLRLGLFGILSFIWICLASVKGGIQLYRNLEDDYFKVLILAITAFCAGFYVALATGDLIYYKRGSAFLGLILGLMGTIWRMREEGEIR